MNGTIWLATSSSPAPVTLTSFNVTIENRNILLKWTAENQVNISEYAVERSSDGRHFIPIGQDASTGNNPNQVLYNFTDLSVPVNQVLYYRLKIIENSGTYTYSEIKAVSLREQKENFAIIQNPTDGNTQLSIDLPRMEQLQISLFTSDGKLLSTQRIDHNPGKQLVPVVLKSYTRGIYIIKVLSTQSSSSLQVIRY